MKQHLQHALLLARTVRHLRGAQVAHRVRLRAQRQAFARYGPAIASRWRRSPDAACWPKGLMPLDEREARGYPDAETNAAGSFRFCNQTRHLGEPPDWEQADAEQLWRYHLHYFEWAWAFTGHHDREWAKDAFVNLWRSWRTSTAFGRSDAWSPYVASLRAWTFCGLHPSLVDGTDAEEEFLADLALHARYLRANVEFDVGGNHLIKNLKALTGLGVFLDDDRLLRFAVRHLYRQVQVQVLDDGGHFERSPSYHCQVLGDLVDVRDLLEATGRPTGQWLHATVNSMQGWLGAMLMPDGGVPFLNDCVPVPAERLGLLEPSGPFDEALVVLASSGYVICRPDRRLHLVADVGPPCPPELPAHAHADCLTFELAVDGERIITDTGLSTYEASSKRDYERSTRAHSTVVVNGLDQTEVWGQFRAARRARATLHEASANSHTARVVAEHDGYRRLPGGPSHQRTWHCTPAEITVIDEVDSRRPVDVCTRFHLAPGLSATFRNGHAHVGPLSVSIPSKLMQIHHGSGEWAASGFGIRSPKQVLEANDHGRRVKIVTRLLTDKTELEVPSMEER